MNLRHAIFFICLHCANSGVSQSSANAVFDRNTVEAGDTFVLRVMVAGVSAKPGKVDFSPWRDLLPADNILSKSDWTRTGGRWVSQFTWIAFDSAGLELPPLNIVLKAGDTLRSNPLALTVKPTYATANLEEAEDIRDIQREPGSWMDYWPWAAGAILFFILIMWLLRRKKPKPIAVVQVPSPPPPVIPPQQLALQKLAVLEQKQLWKQGNLEPFYAELSLIVREYLEGKFQIPALESTTREILPLLKNAGFPENLHSVLRDVLHQSDMTKFAKNPPPEHFHEKALNMARQLILATSPSPNR